MALPDYVLNLHKAGTIHGFNIVEVFPILLDNSSAEAHLRGHESAPKTLAGAAWNELIMGKWNQANKSKRLGAHGMARQKVWK